MNDLISRQAAVDALHTYFRDGFDEDKWWNSTHVLAAIEGLPSVQQWIPFTKRELTAEEQEEHPEWCYIFEAPLPEENQEILVSNGKWVWLDTFCVDDGCYLDSDHELEGCAWMPLPEPYKGEGEPKG